MMLIITGSIGYDYIMDFPGGFGEHILPDQLHHINLSFIANKFERRRGGTAGNVSYSLGLLDTPHILFSYAGKDFDEYKNAFQKLGISTKHVKIDSQAYTATGFAMTDKTHSQIWGYFYGAAENNSKLQLKTVASKADLVLIGPAGTEGPGAFIRQCVTEDINYMFDPGFSLTYISDDDLKLGVTHAAYLIGNDYELDLIKHRIKNWERLFAKQVIITTLGKEGAIISDHGKEYRVSPCVIEEAADPTGAGDAWRSGFLAGLLRGYDLITCGQMGSIAAAYTVEQYGTQEHTYTKRLFTKRYKATYNAEIEL